MARQIASAAINAARDAHYELNPVTGLYDRTLLLEGSRTNYHTYSEDFSGWTPVGAPTRVASAIPASVVGVNMDLLGDGDNVSALPFTLTVNVVGDGVKGHTCFLKAGTAASTEVRLRDVPVGASRLQYVVTWTGGVPSVSYTAGSAAVAPELVGNGIWRFRSLTTGLTAANAHSSLIYPAGTIGAATGDVYAGGFQVEDSFPSSYIPTTTVAVTRAADSLSFPFTLPPQEMTVYAKFVERGTAYIGAASSFIVAIGDIPARLQIVYLTATAGYQATHNNGTSAVTTTLATKPAIGDQVELRLIVAADGRLTLEQSINGAASTSSPTTGPLALATAWTLPRLYLGNIAGGNQAFASFQSVKVARGTKSLAEMRAA